MGMQPRGMDVESIRDIEAQKRADEVEEEALPEGEIRQRGDTVNALINHRYVSLAVLAFLIGLVAGGARGRVLMAMTGFLLTIATFAWLWSRNILVELYYYRKFHHTHAFPRETTDVEIIIENRKWLPVTWVQTLDHWTTHFAPTRKNTLTENQSDPHTGQLINAYSLRWYERVRRQYELEAKKRGVYRIGPASLSSGDPFSLFERVLVTQEKPQYLVVYPERKSLRELGFPLKDPLGDRRVQRRLFEDPNWIIGVRDYQPQDGFRDIHWKATARTGKLQTKLYEPTRGTTIVLAVNIASFEQHWRGVWPEMMEYTLTTAAAIAEWADSQNFGFGLICNGALARADQPIRIPPSQRTNQLRYVLEALAGVEFYVTSEFGRYVLSESPRLPIGATIVMITPFISDMIATTSLRLQKAGRRVVWVTLGKKKPRELHKVRMFHLPIPEEEPEWTDGEFGPINLVPASDQPEGAERPITARQRFLQQKAARQRELEEN